MLTMHSIQCDISNTLSAIIFAPMSMFHDIGFDELEVMFNEVKKYVTIVFFYLIPAKNR